MRRNQVKRTYLIYSVLDYYKYIRMESEFYNLWDIFGRATYLIEILFKFNDKIASKFAWTETAE